MGGTNNSVDPRTAEQIAESKRLADQRAAFRLEWEKQTPFSAGGDRAAYEQAFNAAWNAPGRAQAQSMKDGAAFAAAAKPDKTDTYLRNVGMKRRTGSQQGSILGQVFDPASPLGRGNILGD